MSEEKLAQVYRPSDNQEVLERVQNALTQLYPAEETHRLTRVKPHIWVINQPGYNLMVIVTHMLVIFDAEMFEALPEQRLECCEELLRLNAHHVKSARFCLLKGAVHLRILCENEEIDQKRIDDYLKEFEEQYMLLETQLAKRFYDPAAGATPAPDEPQPPQEPPSEQI